MQFKTPGFYLQDLSPPPPPDGLIETALPAFIGHTEKAEDALGNSLQYVPVRIKDITEYERLFGGAYIPTSYKVMVDSSKANEVVRVELPTHFYLYECLLQFYENGGGDAFIVSVGSYDDFLDLGESKRPTKGFMRGIDAIKNLDDPSLILFPDAVRFPRQVPTGSTDRFPGRFPSLVALQEAAMEQAMARKDRFVIADVFDSGDLQQSATEYRNSLGFGFAFAIWRRILSVVDKFI